MNTNENEVVSDWRWPGVNPIDRAAIALEFSNPFAPNVIADAAAYHRVVRDIFPRKMDQQNIVVQVGAQMPMPLFQAPQAAGVVFDKTNDIGKTVKAFSLFGNSLVFSTSSYDRWEKIWPEAKKVFDLIIPVLENTSNFSTSMTIEYINRIYWYGSDRFGEIKNVLMDGPFVPRNAFTARDFWHNFHGFFSDSDVPERSKSLENINISLGEQPDPADADLGPRRCIEVSISNRCIFEVPVSYIVADTSRPLIDVGTQALTMHRRNKSILREILTEAIVMRIQGLDDR